VSSVYPMLRDIVQFVEESPLAEGPLVRRKVADMYIAFAVGRLLAYRVAWMLDRGIVANYEASVAKLYATELHQQVSAVGMGILGLYGQLDPDSKWAPLKGRIERNCLQSVSATIGAGTSEIQRNIIAARGLGLPRS